MYELEHIKNVMERLSFPHEASECFERIFKRLCSDREMGREFYEARDKFLYSGESDFSGALKCVTDIAAYYGENEYSMHMVFVLSCTPRMYELYMQRGIGEELYWDAMVDIRCKLLECMECMGVPGTFVAGWFGGWFTLERYALGRFQYEPVIYRKRPVELPCGYVLMPGDPVANFHIPSSGVPLTDEVRNASYRKAYEFFSKRYNKDTVVLVCGSWLLYPEHRNFLPANSNILKFMDDFHISSHSQSESFNNSWRVFGRHSYNDISAWPEDSGLRRAYKKWLSDGNKAGDGWGTILMKDGVNITHKKA